MGHPDYQNSSDQEIISRDKEISTILEKLYPGIVIFLIGEMGAGKTSILQSIVKRDSDKYFWADISTSAQNTTNAFIERMEQTFPEDKLILLDEAIALLLMEGNSLAVLKLLAEKGVTLSVTQKGLSQFYFKHPLFFLKHTRALVYLQNKSLHTSGRDHAPLRSL